MGAQLSTVAPTATVPIDAYVAELGDLTYISDLGRGGRFLKSVRAAHRDGDAVVKVLIKPASNTLTIDAARTQLELTQTALQDVDGALPYARTIETERAVYLVRQLIKHNLYDRISTRPFLEPIEKRWLTFQLLRCLDEVHAKGVCHGDIKSENVLVTSWKWLYLADWAPFKPVALPENDSAAFLFFFDTSQRRSCYVAPERFGPIDDKLTPAMDVYSAGCVIAELILEGTPIFTLADLFKYRRGEYKPPLDAIDDENARNLISSMISLDPENRLSAGEYLSKYRGTLFPEYFWTFYDLQRPFAHQLSDNSNAMVESLFNNFGAIRSALGVPLPEPAAPKNTRDNDAIGDGVVVVIDRAWSPKRQADHVGALMPLSFVCSTIRSTGDVIWRLRAGDILLALAEVVPDDARLDRCLPYLVGLVRDDETAVQISGLRAVAHLLGMVEDLTVLNDKVFSEYLFPRLRFVLTSPSVQLRATYAQALSVIAEHAVRLGPADLAMNAQIEEHMRLLLTDKSSIVRRAFLEHAPPLCAILGRAKTNDIVLSHAITYLNDKDSRVRIDLFRFVGRVGPLLGPSSLEQYVIPLMVQSTVDPREDVVAAVLAALVSLAELGLIRSKVLWDVLPLGSKFFIHPSLVIRTQAFLLVAAAAKHMTPAQTYCLLAPSLAPLLETRITDYSDVGALVSAAKPAMAVAVYSLCLTWAAQSRKATFWRREETTFSPEDRRWLERLRDVGFNNEDLWQLLVLKEYIWQVAGGKEEEGSSPTKLNIVPQTWTGEGTPPRGIEKYVRSRRAVAAIAASNNASSDKVEGEEVDQSGTSRAASRTASRAPSRAPSPTPNSAEAKSSPAGTLVSTIKAHRGAITSLAIPQCSTFFLSGADDGLVRLWDVVSLEKGATRPSFTHDFGSPVKSLTFSGPSTFWVGTDNGKLCKMSCGAASGADLDAHDKKPSFGPIEQLRTIDLSGSIIELHTTPDYLYALDSNCTIFVICLATFKVHTLQNPVEHGPPTSWVFDRHDQWVAIGTAHGVIELWDLRFELHVQSFGVGSLRPISAMVLHPRANGCWVVVAGGFETPLISIWDVQNQECRELLVPVSPQEEESPLPNLAPVGDLTDKFASWSLEPRGSKMALASYPERSGNHQRILSGGSDRILRFWNLQAPNMCSVVSGLPYTHARMVYSGRIGSNVKYIFEKAQTVRKPERLSRTAVILNEESDIGRNHRGAITKVGVLNHQREMIVSVDEVGCIKVYL